MLWLYKPKHGLVSDHCLKPNLFKASVQECGCVPKHERRCGREDKKGGNIQVSRRSGLGPHHPCLEKPWRLDSLPRLHALRDWSAPSPSFSSALIMPILSLTARSSVMPTHTYQCPWFIKTREASILPLWLTNYIILGWSFTHLLNGDNKDTCLNVG